MPVELLEELLINDEADAVVVDVTVVLCWATAAPAKRREAATRDFIMAAGLRRKRK